MRSTAEKVTPEARQLKIKSGVVRRLAKEVTMYQKEAEKQEIHIQHLINSGADEHDVRKQNEVLEETLVMIPDTQRRLQEAFQELELLKITHDALRETTEYEEAEVVLNEARPQLCVK